MVPSATANSIRASILCLLMSMLSPSASAIARDEILGNGLLGRALICFYRSLDWGSEGRPYTVRVHDEYVGGLSIGSFLHHLTEPGRRIVFVEADVNVSRSFLVQGGEIYYVQVARTGGAVLSRPKLLPVDAAKGMREIGSLSYAGTDFSNDARQYCLRNDAS